MSESVITRALDQIGHIVINRADQRNSLNLDTIKSLESSVKKFSKDSSIRCIMLYGEGDRAFCAGADLNEISRNSKSKFREKFFGGIGEVIKSMHRSPKIIIAKVHGYALAGGCGLAAAADITLASDESYFGLPEIKLGLAPLVVMLPISRVIQMKSLIELSLTGENITAKRAFEIGLVSKVSPKNELDQYALKTAQTIATYNSSTLSVAKRSLYELGKRDYFSTFTQYAKRSAKLSLSRGAREGISAFLGKRGSS